MKLAVIGYGYWGPNLVRNFSSIENLELKVVCDTNKEREKEFRKRYQNIEFSLDWKEVIGRTDIDAVAIATPVFTHYELCREALLNGKHVFVEKPFTSSVAQGEELVELARKKNLTIMVDHTFLFTGAVKKIDELVRTGVLGDIFYFDSTRVNLGLFQPDLNVIWDLAPHDLSILKHVLKEPIREVSVSGMNCIFQFEDVAYITLYFDSNIIAHLHVNWLSPVKIRQILIGGNKKMLIWNDILADDKIKVYDKGVEIKTMKGVYKNLVNYRSGDMWAPKVESIEALNVEARYFMECVTTQKDPFNNGEAGLEIVKVLEACDKSLKNQGKRVAL